MAYVTTGAYGKLSETGKIYAQLLRLGILDRRTVAFPETGATTGFMMVKADKGGSGLVLARPVAITTTFGRKPYPNTINSAIIGFCEAFGLNSSDFASDLYHGRKTVLQVLSEIGDKAVEREIFVTEFLETEKYAHQNAVKRRDSINQLRHDVLAGQDRMDLTTRGGIEDDVISAAFDLTGEDVTKLNEALAKAQNAQPGDDD